jgi:hypothetical protein
VNDGVYSWQVDVSPTTQARVKVIAYDAAANSGDDVSDADFTIADTESPTATVLAPNGGEVWDVDSTYSINWTASDNIGVSSVDILLSIDGGVTYPHTIATGEANDGVYPWQVDVSPTTQARVKVIAYDDGGNQGEDASDDNFEISDPTSGVGDIPTRAVITGVVPNPFIGTTSIRFGIPEEGRVRIDVYDVSGRLAGEIVQKAFSSGYHSVDWANNGSLEAGLYFVRLSFGSEEVTRKAVISH